MCVLDICWQSARTRFHAETKKHNGTKENKDSVPRLIPSHVKEQIKEKRVMPLTRPNCKNCGWPVN